MLCAKNMFLNQKYMQVAKKFQLIIVSNKNK